MDYSVLKTEITTDPQGKGYAGKTDQQVADLLNAIGTDTKERGVIPAHEIVDATVPSEWSALTADEKQRYQTIVSAGQVNVKNPNIRAAFQAMFAGGTTTRTALTALTTEKTSRAEALGFGKVAYWDVERAKAL